MALAEPWRLMRHHVQLGSEGGIGRISGGGGGSGDAPLASIVVAGMPATGKSAFARRLAAGALVQPPPVGASSLPSSAAAPFQCYQPVPLSSCMALAGLQAPRTASAFAVQRDSLLVVDCAGYGRAGTTADVNAMLPPLTLPAPVLVWFAGVVGGVGASVLDPLCDVLRAREMMLSTTTACAGPFQPVATLVVAAQHAEWNAFAATSDALQRALFAPEADDPAVPSASRGARMHRNAQRLLIRERVRRIVCVVAPPPHAAAQHDAAEQALAMEALLSASDALGRGDDDGDDPDTTAVIVSHSGMVHGVAAPPTWRTASIRLAAMPPLATVYPMPIGRNCSAASTSDAVASPTRGERRPDGDALIASFAVDDLIDDLRAKLSRWLDHGGSSGQDDEDAAVARLVGEGSAALAQLPSPAVTAAALPMYAAQSAAEVTRHRGARAEASKAVRVAGIEEKLRAHVEAALATMQLLQQVRH
jgi:hypothetical protein